MVLGAMMDDSNKEDNEQEKYQIYRDERKSLIDTNNESSFALDKALLTLSAGALGLSLTFLDKNPDKTKVAALGCLHWSWYLFVACILIVLLSFKLSQKACERQIEILEQDFLSENDSGKQQENCYAIILSVVNFLSIILFIVGTGLLVYFSVQNS